MKTVHLYTDGSSNYKRKLVGSGAVLVNPKLGSEHYTEEAVVGTIVRPCDYPQLIKYNNVAGEILACCYGIEKCIELGYEHVIIFVDYIGLIHWFNGSWRTNNKFTKTYVNMMRQYRKHIEINFKKVKSHKTGYRDVNNEWNDYADRLAKKALQ